MVVSAVIVGYGDRGSIYGKYAVDHPELLEIKAVVDPNEFKLNLAKERFHLRDEQLFTSFEEFIAKDKFADATIVATMDELHYYHGKSCLEKGYHMLIEKPVVNNEKELLELRDLAAAKGLFMMVGHVLRYTPFYTAIKQEVLNGAIGKIIHMQTNEFVGISHTSCSYARGKWKNEKECGSSMLLAKCCHDLDLICWLNNQTTPVSVVSMGGRNNLVKENAPVDSTARCLDCPHVDTCIYSAKSLYLLNDLFPHYSFAGIDKPHDQITMKEKIEALKTDDPFGECIYKTTADVVDHQSLIVKFENGSTAVHSMISAVPRPGRSIHLIGTKGEIEGFFESGTYVVRKQNFQTSWYDKREVDVNDLVDKTVGHGGGDSLLMEDFVRILRKEEPSISTTKIDDSIASHICVYKADESLRDGEFKMINIE
ncbi:MAG: Gfo/Idh/MocA family protein [Bacilli bacterium]|jgi:predicted dehydrogenase